MRYEKINLCFLMKLCEIKNLRLLDKLGMTETKVILNSFQNRTNLDELLI